MTLQRRIRRSRALELAEYRLERLELKVEQMNKGMRIASHAFERFNRAVRELSAEAKMDEDVCPDCNGEGEHVVCCDDICVGQGRCIHGEDGMEVCDACCGEGVVWTEGED